MPRPPVDFQEQVVHPDDKDGVVKALREQSLYQIHRAYTDVKTKTAAYTMDPVFDRVILADAAGGAFTVLLPDAASADYTEYVVIRINDASPDNAVAVDTVSGNIDGSGSAISLTAQYKSIRVVTDGANYFRTDDPI